MHKLWRAVSMVAFACFLLGILGIGVGFFTGSSPTAIQAHGHLAQYWERLSLNWDILRQDLEQLSLKLGSLWQSLSASLGL